uniref:Fungal lipase-like domain-containing protein n=1 Tax=Panagrolaimus sp. ES5 TaxID=591445 RepID=A0AC34FQ03_9BILA
MSKIFFIWDFRGGKTFGDDAHLYTVFTSNNLVCDFLKDSCASYTLVNEHEKRIYVIFRGTKTKKQLILEGWTTLFPKKDFYGVGMANKYFLNALEILWPHVQPVFADPRYQNFDVTFTGHSLGGALAALGALKAVIDQHRNGTNIHLYTFGEPRIGNSELAASFDDLLPNSYRIVHADDIVPHLPACKKDHLHPRIIHDVPHLPACKKDHLHPRIIHDGDDSKPCDSWDISESYHHGIEIWYPYGMGLNSPYYECLGTPKNEDFDCSDSLSFELTKYSQYIFSHRHYFEHKVPPFGKLGFPPFGKLGCKENKQPLEEQMSIDAEVPAKIDIESAVSEMVPSLESASATENVPTNSAVASADAGFSVKKAWKKIREKFSNLVKD